jgi:hypothetical protein
MDVLIPTFSNLTGLRQDKHDYYPMFIAFAKISISPQEICTWANVAFICVLFYQRKIKKCLKHKYLYHINKNIKRII